MMPSTLLRSSRLSYKCIKQSFPTSAAANVVAKPPMIPEMAARLSKPGASFVLPMLRTFELVSKYFFGCYGLHRRHGCAVAQHTGRMREAVLPLAPSVLGCHGVFRCGMPRLILYGEAGGAGVVGKDSCGTTFVSWGLAN